MTAAEIIKEHNRKTEEAMSGVTNRSLKSGKFGGSILEKQPVKKEQVVGAPKPDSTEEGFSEELIQAITARIRQEFLGESQTFLDDMKRAGDEEGNLGKGGLGQEPPKQRGTDSDPSFGKGGLRQESRQSEERVSDPSFAGIMEETIQLITARVRQAVLDELDPLLEAMQRAAQGEAQPGTGGFETTTSSMSREQTSYAEACDAKVREMQEQMEQAIENKRKQLFARISAKGGL
jgi:hypothetical protein